MKSALRRSVAIGLLTYLGVLVVLMALERFMVYPAPPRSEGDWIASKFSAEDVYFESADGTKIHGWYVEHPNPEGHVLFCHGNGEHVGYFGTWLSRLSQRLQVSILAFDYRGYGKSEGKPFQQGVLEDAAAAHRCLAERAGLEMQQVVLYGRSLGGGVATYLAGEFGARALVIERTFHSMVEVGASHYPWAPIRRLMRNRYPSVEWIAQYDGPLLQMHGTRDRIVPLESAKSLFAACRSNEKEFLEVPGMGHNDFAPDEFYVRFEQLIDDLNVKEE